MNTTSHPHAGHTLGLALGALLLTAAAAGAQSNPAQSPSLTALADDPVEAGLLTISELHGGAMAADGVFDADAPGWFVLGFALGGSQGLPTLTGSGGLEVGAETHIDLDHAAEDAISVLLVGLDHTNVAYKGGVVIPDVAGLGFYVMLRTSADGDVHSVVNWPAGIPAGTEVFMQYLIQDAEAVQGVAFSNALVVRA